MPITMRNLLLIGIPLLIALGFTNWTKTVKEQTDVISSVQPLAELTEVPTVNQANVEKKQTMQSLPGTAEMLVDGSLILESESEQPSQAWLSQPTNALSNALYEFIETEQVSYLSTEDVPFSEEQRNAIMALSKNGSMLMFDNTESDYLDSYGLSESEVVSEFFGSAAEGDVILATSVRNEQGGIHYLVLPLQQTDGQSEAEWAETVKSAIELFKEQQEVELNKESFVKG